tara:strand:+ start:4943 stop:5611 length:669 start_codon:yes stop_codon:yes gene_type:complete
MTITKPSNYSSSYYSFEEYNSKQRMLTYWYQIREILALRPKNVLEVGIGTGLVTSYLRHVGIQVTTFDINPALEPDIVGSVLEINDKVMNKFDVVLCARVLHHLPYEDFPDAIRALAKVSKSNAVVTLPNDDFRIYFMARYTSSPFYSTSIPLPLSIKRLMTNQGNVYNSDNKYRSGLWKVGEKWQTKNSNVEAEIGKIWSIEKSYAIPEDSAHQVFVLKKC